MGEVKVVKDSRMLFLIYKDGERALKEKNHNQDVLKSGFVDQVEASG